MMVRLVAGSLVSAAISAGGWRANALSGRGALAATGVGTGIAVGSSWPGVLVLGSFFVSSSAVSRATRNDGVVARGNRRDERQVLANGAVATVGAMLGGRIDRTLAVALVGGALSAATADTWATELGGRSYGVPRLILSGQAVPRGTSGGVTRRGSLAALGGAAAIGAITGALAGPKYGWGHGFWIGTGVFVAGLAGSLTDSLLGELAQERRRCPDCNVMTEARVHQCGAQTVHAGGVRGVDNDIVNLACTLVGCLAVLPFARDVNSSRRGRSI